MAECEKCGKKVDENDLMHYGTIEDGEAKELAVCEDCLYELVSEDFEQ